MKTVVFRADGNKTIGTGHVMRCLALAFAFSTSGYHVTFAMSDDSLQKKIRKYGFDFINVDSRFDDYSVHSVPFFNYIKTATPSIVVVDNYSVKVDYLLQIRQLTKVLYISEDYDPTMVNAVDYFLNYNIYMNCVIPIQSDGIQLLGTQFTLLRDEFAKPLRDSTPEHKTITVFTGGSDFFNIAPGLVQQLAEEDRLHEYHIIVVSGPLNPNIPKLMSLANSCSKISIVIDPTSISDVMDNTSIAISSGGSILYELCSRGIPTISFSLASNQENIVLEFNKLGLIPYAGNMIANKDKAIKNCVNLAVKVNSSPSHCAVISQRMVDICNKHGTELVVKIISKSL